LMSGEMVDELLRVLAYPKFELSEEEIYYLLYVEVLPYTEMIDHIIFFARWPLKTAV